MWNDIIVLNIFRNSDEFPLFRVLDIKDLNLRYDTESQLNSSFSENHNVVSQFQTMIFPYLLLQIITSLRMKFFYDNTTYIEQIFREMSKHVVCPKIFVLVLEFYGSVNNEVMSSRSVNRGTVPGQTY